LKIINNEDWTARFYISREHVKTLEKWILLYPKGSTMVLRRYFSSIVSAFEIKLTDFASGGKDWGDSRIK